MQEDIFFGKVGGKKIFGIFTSPAKKSRNLVIMNHGFRGSNLGPARTFVDFSRILNENGFCTFRFDQPNGGNSEGDYIESSFSEWIKTTCYFIRKFLKQGYSISLLGQSMGATLSGVVASKTEFRNRIESILLWVPGVSDPKYKISEKKIYEENGQKYPGSFWLEAAKENFPDCLQNYPGRIHLVFGDKDRYVDENLRQKVINVVRAKKQQILILKNQDHSPWEYKAAQKVYRRQLKFLIGGTKKVAKS